MNCAPANVSLRVLRETFFYTFREALREAGAVTVMASYNEIDGVPSHANKWLLRDVLRKEMGLQRLRRLGLLRDLGAGLPSRYARPLRCEGQEGSLRPRGQGGRQHRTARPDCYLHLVELVKKGVLKESQLDELVAPMLFWKFEMGLFDDPYVDPERAPSASSRLKRASRAGA